MLPFCMFTLGCVLILSGHFVLLGLALALFPILAGLVLLFD